MGWCLTSPWCSIAALKSGWNEPAAALVTPFAHRTASRAKTWLSITGCATVFTPWFEHIRRVRVL